MLLSGDGLGVPYHTSLKIAFCTDDMKQVNQHFGSAKTFAVYAVDMEHSELLEAAGMKVEALARIASLTDDRIVFID